MPHIRLTIINKGEASYREAEKITWDCEIPLYSQIHDKYLSDKDEIIEVVRIGVETLGAITIKLIKHATPGVVREAR
ncbi:MAG: hypothetical protein DU481_15415 [Nitrosomonas sp.]|uniref:hypothetical protein n=1 Tax=Nitrosomonas sp. TaxID=42353 RepID=UPI0032F090C4